MRDEKGYVQFACDWERAPAPAGPMLDDLRAWRDRLHRLGLIGVYPNGIGYGNLSVRPEPGDCFVITGTATGGLAAIGAEHLTEVTAYDFDRNWLHCRGPVQASSESLSHAAVYRCDPGVRAVVHVHHLGLWERLATLVPATEPGAEAGTPAMARAIEELFERGQLRGQGLFVMSGHREGLMAFAGEMEEAGRLLEETLGRFGR